MAEKVYKVSDGLYLYAVGPNEFGKYVGCYVYSIDDGRLLWPTSMRVFPALVVEHHDELDPYESGRVIVAVSREYPVH